MIKEKNGEVKLNGTVTQLTAEFSTIVKSIEDALVKNGYTKEEAQAEIDDCIKLARMSMDELQIKLHEELERIIKLGEDNGKADSNESN